jgi:hypothetical protein
MTSARSSTVRAFAYDTSVTASRNGAHRHAVIPSARCGQVVAESLRMRKK